MAIRKLVVVGFLIIFGMMNGNNATASNKVAAVPDIKTDETVTLRFFGTPDAELFTREIGASFQGVLKSNFIANAGNGFPAGFVRASPVGQPWGTTMWTRDSGTYMRELTMRGYYNHASLLAECLINLVEKNEAGYYSFPRFFRGDHAGSGTEVDGTSSVIIGMSLLWERLPNGNPTKKHIGEFLFQSSSPLNYFKYLLQDHPLVAGTGEFGCGMRIPGECYNVVQNDLTMLALLVSARVAAESGNEVTAQSYRNLASRLWKNIAKYLVAKDGSWIWCIDMKTLKPNPAVLDASVNRGFGGIDGLGTMYADVLGFSPSGSDWRDVERNERTLQDLYRVALRKEEFEKYGIWTQFDVIGHGFLTSPSYGQGYSLQTMLLDDNLMMAQKNISFLAEATYQPVPEYKLQRTSPYYFYERLYSPDAVGKIFLDAGCGALNLVNVTEPLKVSRIILGVDDTSLEQVKIIPRLPANWKGVEAYNWPIRTSHGIARAHTFFEKIGKRADFFIKLDSGEEIDDLRVRLPSKNGFVWRESKHVRSVRFTVQ